MLIAANWKMNLDKKSIKSFVEHLKIYNFSKNVQLCIFPPTIYIDFLSKLIKNIPISIGGQNCHHQSFGAFTGEKCAQFGIKSSLRPIICVGENLDQRENGKAIDFIEKQITDCLPEDFNELTIAYEPIWSIGTGKIPLQSEIREMHKNIKEIVFSKSKKNVKVLYGGSVNKQNIQDILSVNIVDGVLVGGASLKIKDFLAIYGSAVKHLKKL